MKSFHLTAGCLAAVALLSACSTTLDNKKKYDYRSVDAAATTPVKSLDVPPDLTPLQTDGTFSLPTAAVKPGASAAVEVQPGLLPKADNAHVERAGSQRWLVVNLPADKVWPVVREFWQQQGFVIATENPQTGILETDWAENRAKLPQDFLRKTLGRVIDSVYSTGERDKFRTRLERGASGNTEIYVSHRGMVEVYASSSKDSTVWQPSQPDPDLEAAMLNDLMQRFNTAAAPVVKPATGALDNATAPVVAPDVVIPSTATAPIDTTLSLNEPFDRAWRRVGLALDRIGFTVVDRDRLRGIYYIRYADPDSSGREKGFLGGMFADRTKGAAEDYQLEVVETAGKSTLRVLSNTGKPESTDITKRIAQLLYEQLK